MNKRFISAMLTVLMLTSFLAGCTGTDDTSTDTTTDTTTGTNGTSNATTNTTATNTVKIGLLSPQTGPISVYAAGFESAAAVAVADLNAAGDTTFELVVADSGCEATQAATSAQTLVDSGVVGIAGAACSGATLGAIAVAKEAGVPMVSYASTSPAVTTADDGGHLFRVVPSDAQQAVAMKDLVTNRSGSSVSVGVLYMTNDYGSGLADNFEAAWGSALCAKAGYDPESFDASTLAGQVSSCDVLVTVTYAADGAAIVEELAVQGYTGQIYGADGIADANFGNEFSDIYALDGVIATQPRPGTTSAMKTAFETAYAAAGGNASGIYTHETYDAVKMIGLAYNMENGSNMKTHLKMVGTDFVGASGTHTFDANGDVVGTGYNACDFSTGTGVTDFACNQIWTQTGGIAAAGSSGAGTGTVTTMKIGLLSPQTGPIAVYADGFEEAAQVAIDRLNALDPAYQFELVVADSGCDGTQAATSAQTLVDAGVVAIAGAACSGATLGAIAVAKEAGVPMVSYASTSPAVTTADDGGHLFRVVPSDAQQSVALKDVVADAGVSNPAVLYMTNDYGSGLADNFEAAWDGSLCAKAGYDPESFDASTLAGQITSCDSVVLVSYATDGAAIIEELATQGWTGKIFGADGIADANFDNAFSDNSTLNNVVTTKPKPAGGSALKAYFNSVFTNTSAIYTHETFDAITVIGMAAMMEDGANMKMHIKMVGDDFRGASGSHTFDANGDVIGSGYAVCTFTHDATSSTVAFTCDRKWGQADGLADA